MKLPGGSYRGRPARTSIADTHRWRPRMQGHPETRAHKGQSVAQVNPFPNLSARPAGIAIPGPASVEHYRLVM